MIEFHDFYYNFKIIDWVKVDVRPTKDSNILMPNADGISFLPHNCDCCCLLKDVLPLILLQLKSISRTGKRSLENRGYVYQVVVYQWVDIYVSSAQGNIVCYPCGAQCFFFLLLLVVLARALRARLLFFFGLFDLDHQVQHKLFEHAYSVLRSICLLIPP